MTLNKSNLVKYMFTCLQSLKFLLFQTQNLMYTVIGIRKATNH